MTKNLSKNIIFDFDGVLEDTFDMNFALSKMKYPDLEKDEYVAWHDGNVIKSISTISNVNKEFDFDKEKTIEIMKRDMDQNIISFLKKLKENDSKLYIVSSSADSLLNDYLDKNGVLNLFSKILGKHSNPSKVEKFNSIFEEFDFDIDQSVFITDTLGDIVEANEVGLKSVAITGGFHDRERLEKGRPFLIVDSIEELAEELDKL